MKLGLLGGTGQVGRELLRAATRRQIQIDAPTSKVANLVDLKSLETWVQSNNFDFLVNCAAYTDVVGAESDPELAFQINEQGIRNLATAASEADIPVIHLSTDYVFDGTKGEPYVESDLPNPINVYGASKLAGERVLLEACPNSLILRVSLVFSPWGNNLVKTLVRKCMQGEQLKLVGDNSGGPCGASAVAESILVILAGYPRKKQTIYHFCTHPLVSTYEFGSEVVETCYQLGLIKEAVSMATVSSADYFSTVQRPLNSGLLSEYLQPEFGIRSHDWHTDLTNTISEMMASHASR